MVCFTCGKYGHVKEGCHLNATVSKPEKMNLSTEPLLLTASSGVDSNETKSDSYGPGCWWKKGKSVKTGMCLNPKIKTWLNLRKVPDFRFFLQGMIWLTKNR